MKKTSTILNRTWVTFIIGTLLFTCFSVYFFIRGEWPWAWISIGCVLLFLLCSFITPAIYRIDNESIRIYYIPISYEKFLWKNVDSVTVDYDLAIPYIFDYFLINGEREDTPRFYKEGKVPFSGRAKRIIEECYGKNIEGYISDEIKGFSARRRAKLELQATPSVGEAQAIERKARKLVREAISQSGVDRNTLEIEYYYSTADGTRRDRPAIDYTYCVLISEKQTKTPLTNLTLASIKLRRNTLRGTLSPTEDLVSQIAKAITL